MEDPQPRPLPGLEKKYLVTSEGDIISTKTGTKKVKHINNAGYYTVNLFQDVLSKPGNFVRKLVHRLVAETFIGGLSTGLQVNHLNGNKLDNSLVNLEVVTRSQNMLHALATGLTTCKGEGHHNATLSEDQVKEICNLIVTTNLFYKEIAALYGVSTSAINNIASKHRWVSISDEYWQGKVHRLANRNRDKRRLQVESKRGGVEVANQCLNSDTLAS